ncbi:MAG: hypothetical protein WA892_07970 [Ornithinimicrobium sp.]
MSESDKNRLDISWTNAAGSALGAVSSAVLLSTLGVVGTLLGAALGSLCITVGGALYAHSMNVTKEKAAAAARRTAKPRQSASVGSRPSSAQTQRDQVPERESTSPAKESRGSVFSGLPWKRIIGLAAALFAVTMAIILAFELTTGRAVSTYTGGTENTGVGTSVPGVSGTGVEAPGGDDIVPEDVVPDEVVPDEVVPDEVIPDDVVPDEVVPGDDAPAG